MHTKTSNINSKILQVITSIDAEIADISHKINTLQRFLSSDRYGHEQKKMFWNTLRTQFALLKSLRSYKKEKVEAIMSGKSF